MLTKADKKELVEEIISALNNSPVLIFSDFKGLTVAQSNELRTELFKKYGDKCVFKVVRNTLLRTAIKQSEKNLEDYKPFLVNSTAVFYVTEGDPIDGIKVLTEFSKKYKGKPSIKGGVLEGQIFNAEKAQELAKLPSREEMLSMFLRGMNAPITGFVNVLAGTIRSLSNVLNAIKENKEKSQ